ncbi:MAG: alpha-amylase family glycosyl hydrolase [Bacteroidota bacterium]
MNTSLYEINTRVWIKRFGPDAKLLDVPQAYWQQLAQLGIEFVWLMGVWKTGPNVLDYALEEGLQQAYSRVLPDWTEEDIIGSPYAIDRYELLPSLGETADLVTLRDSFHDLGLRLILDFVPNHFHAESSWIAERPEVFLETDAHYLREDKHTFYEAPSLPGRYFAHGKDPYFPAWQDTIQVDYRSADAQQFMLEQLERIALYCDGVRCDMAMLPIQEVRQRTWGFLPPRPRPTDNDFWPSTIQNIKQIHPDFIFLAEVYWDMEWRLQEMGFDYTYDKRLLDRLHRGKTTAVYEHLLADVDFQSRSARFLENHDEDRILHFLSPNRAHIAALIAYTTPGMRFFYQGQWEGRRKRLPVQLGREPQEVDVAGYGQSLRQLQITELPAFAPLNTREPAFYDYLLRLLQLPILQEGKWSLVKLPNHPTDVLSWQWTLDNRRILIVLNDSSITHWVSLPESPGQIWVPFLLEETFSADYFSPFAWGVFMAEMH